MSMAPTFPMQRNFFTNKLLKVTPNISQEAINQSIEFLERQKEANCPCTIHTQKRGHEWIVFNRLPDRIPSNHDDGSHMSDSDDTVGFSETEDNAENEEAVMADTTSGSQNHEDMGEEDKNNNQDCTDASGASSEDFTPADLTAGYNSIFNPTVSNSSSELSLISRDERHIRYKKNVTKQNKRQKKNKRPAKTTKTSVSDFEQADLIPDDILEESEQGIDSSTPCKFDQVVYRDNVKGKTYSFRYFKTYRFDWRLLLNHPNGEPVECKCPRGRLHSQQCPWYCPNVINVSDIRNNLSTSEQAAQGKIYMYQNTQNGQQELCGCGTAAEIAYLGHKSTFEEFQWIHERSSYEMLLAILKKRKKVSFFEHNNKRPRLQSISDSNNKEDVTDDAKKETSMDNPSTSNTAPSSLAVLAEVSQSNSSQDSLPDLFGEQNGGPDCPCEEDEDMPPVEGDEIIKL